MKRRTRRGAVAVSLPSFTRSTWAPLVSHVVWMAKQSGPGVKDVDAQTVRIIKYNHEEDTYNVKKLAGKGNTFQSVPKDMLSPQVDGVPRPEAQEDPTPATQHTGSAPTPTPTTPVVLSYAQRMAAAWPVYSQNRTAARQRAVGAAKLTAIPVALEQAQEGNRRLRMENTRQAATIERLQRKMKLQKQPGTSQYKVIEKIVAAQLKAQMVTQLFTLHMVCKNMCSPLCFWHVGTDLSTFSHVNRPHLSNLDFAYQKQSTTCSVTTCFRRGCQTRSGPTGLKMTRHKAGGCGRRWARLISSGLCHRVQKH